MSIRKPLTSSIQTIGLSSILLGCPLGIKLANPEHCPNRFQIGCPSALRYAERLIDGQKRQVRGLAWIVEKVDPPDGSHDPTGPGLQPSSK